MPARGEDPHAGRFRADQRRRERGQPLAGGEARGLAQRIAEEAGIARTTFYGHFADKPTLLIRLTESVSEELFAGAGTWVEGDRSREDLVQTVLGLVTGYRDHARLLRAVVEVAGYEPTVEAFWQARLEAFADVLRQRLERDRGPADAANLAITASWIVWGTERTIAVHVASRPPGEDIAFAGGVAGAIWATMQGIA